MPMLVLHLECLRNIRIVRVQKKILSPISFLALLRSFRISREKTIKKQYRVSGSFQYSFYTNNVRRRNVKTKTRDYETDKFS